MIHLCVCVLTCIEISIICVAWSRILGDCLAAAVSVAEHPGSSHLLQLLCSSLLYHRGCRQLCHLLLQRSSYQPATVGSDPMVNPVPRSNTDLLQQSDHRGVGYDRGTRCHNISCSTSLLYAWHSSICQEILVRNTCVDTESFSTHRRCSVFDPHWFFCLKIYWFSLVIFYLSSFTIRIPDISCWFSPYSCIFVLGFVSNFRTFLVLAINNVYTVCSVCTWKRIFAFTLVNIFYLINLFCWNRHMVQRSEYSRKKLI